MGLLRRFAPRNDGGFFYFLCNYFLFLKFGHSLRIVKLKIDVHPRGWTWGFTVILNLMVSARIMGFFPSLRMTGWGFYRGDTLVFLFWILVFGV
jgi:hypothetical protein